MSAPYALHQGDCRAVMATVEAESIDAIVSDPPYGLGFMGKEWDHGVPGEPFWAEALRVAKPGAHLVAFGGSRTFHRLVCAVEDAGWEIRDVLMWVYGSGFPKSLDVSKAIDKAAGAEREVIGESPWSSAKMDAGRGVSGLRQAGSFAGGYEASRVNVPVTAPATDAARQWSGWGTALKPAYEPIILARKPLRGTVARNVQTFGTGALNVDGCRVKTHDLKGQRPSGSVEADGGAQWEHAKSRCSSCAGAAEANAKHATPATRESSAASHAGQTSSEKAQLVLADTSRTDTGCSAGPSQEARSADRSVDSSSSTSGHGEPRTEKSPPGSSSTTSTTTGSTTGLRICASCGGESMPSTTSPSTPATASGARSTRSEPESEGPHGRWPSNILLDEAAAAVLDEMSGELQSPATYTRSTHAEGEWLHAKPAGSVQVGHGDRGGASRFFYTSKASGEDRGRWQGNDHPTVKPTDLMRWLCRLVTPPGGLILDPFMGSGSTGVAAVEEGFRFVGIDIEQHHVDIAERRLKHAVRQPGLFDTGAA